MGGTAGIASGSAGTGIKPKQLEIDTSATLNPGSRFHQGRMATQESITAMSVTTRSMVLADVSGRLQVLTILDFPWPHAAWRRLRLLRRSPDPWLLPPTKTLLALAAARLPQGVQGGLATRGRLLISCEVRRDSFEYERLADLEEAVPCRSISIYGYMA
jgi:hypothetical protein